MLASRKLHGSFESKATQKPSIFARSSVRATAGAPCP